MVNYFLSFILGTIFGSFANVLIYRIPKKLSIIFPSSFCPNCKNKIKFYDNIPIISYIILKGKCRYCGEKISLKYPVVEFISGIIFLLSYYHYGLSLLTLKSITICFLMLVMAFIDLETGFIYNSILFPSLYLGLILSFSSNHLLASTITAFFGFIFGILVKILGEKIFKKEALGEGDPYVFALIGIFAYGLDLFFVLFISFFIGSITGIFLLFKEKKNYMPLLPFLFVGILIYFLILPFFKINLYNLFF